MKRWLAFTVMLMLDGCMGGSSAVAAGVDSRAYSCAGLQSLVAAHGFVFISQATFGDFVVANVSYCAGAEVLELRSVATSDRAECPVNYCVSRGRIGGSGM
jgi:hypothetical protein